MAVDPLEVRYVSQMVAAGIMEAAAMPGHQGTLERAVRTWFPDPDKVDAYEIRRVVEQVRTELQLTRASIMGRAERWVSEGKAKKL